MLMKMRLLFVVDIILDDRNNKWLEPDHIYIIGHYNPFGKIMT